MGWGGVGGLGLVRGRGSLGKSSTPTPIHPSQLQILDKTLGFLFCLLFLFVCLLLFFWRRGVVKSRETSRSRQSCSSLFVLVFVSWYTGRPRRCLHGINATFEREASISVPLQGAVLFSQAGHGRRTQRGGEGSAHYDVSRGRYTCRRCGCCVS